MWFRSKPEPSDGRFCVTLPLRHMGSGEQDKKKTFHLHVDKIIDGRSEYDQDTAVGSLNLKIKEINIDS